MNANMFVILRAGEYCDWPPSGDQKSPPKKLQNMKIDPSVIKYAPEKIAIPKENKA